MRRSKLRSREGSSLIELVVGSAIAIIVLGAVVGLQIATYRQSRSDQARFESQTEVTLAMERIVQDLRRGVNADPDGSSLTLELEADSGELRSVRYWLEDATGELVRAEAGSARVLTRGVTFLEFSPTAEGAVEIVIRARLAGDQRYELTSLVTPGGLR